ATTGAAGAAFAFWAGRAGHAYSGRAFFARRAGRPRGTFRRSCGTLSSGGSGHAFARRPGRPQFAGDALGPGDAGDPLGPSCTSQTPEPLHAERPRYALRPSCPAQAPWATQPG